MNVIYLPAIWRSALENRWGSSPLNAMDPRLHGTAAYHPYALTSYADPSWRNQPFRWEPEDFIFGDSGGYSVATRGIEIDPRDAVRWQMHRCSVGAILDAPPWSNWSRWRECLACTVANAKAALPLYLRARAAGSSFRWWGVVHGRTRAELEEWWTAIARIYPFTEEGEGWAFKPHPLNDPEALAHVLAFIADKGIRRAHFFASTGQNAVETLFALGPEAGLTHASMDSQSALQSGFHRNVTVPTPYGSELIKERFRDTGGKDTRARDHMMQVCTCHSCALLREDLREEEELRADESYLYHRMMFHNVLAVLSVHETLRQRYAVAAFAERSLANVTPGGRQPLPGELDRSREIAVGCPTVGSRVASRRTNQPARQSACSKGS